jgi:VWFA-related protein
VATFNSSLRALVDWRPYDATSIDQLKAISVSGGTSLFVSVADFANRMRQTPHRKRAMLVITDGADDVVQMQRAQRFGGDAGSGAPAAIIDYADRAANALRTGEVLVYGLGLAWTPAVGQNSDFHLPSLQRLVEPTGGAVAVTKTMTDVRLAARRLADELRQQYTLGFYPSKAPDGKYRRVSVRVKNQNYRIRTRAGYLATRRK